ncbi:cytochrome P450 [Dactylonectria macrodidyma]|uniref:Cytochrome P450 n=1 Tax=Dactylonectria macrodidyma TaxID=307937 RepID=A0A9P9JC13_9HYPO|nr:cytochrome P450 [Dactylonectria macrodidyma]
MWALVRLVLAFVVTLPVLYTLKILIIDYVLDPLGLRKYPSPNFFAATTPLWLLRETWFERRSKAIHEQHQRLGDIVRVGANQLIFNIPEAVTDIYSHSAARKLEKDVFYDAIAGDTHDIVNTRDRGDHSQRRKYLSNAFALRTVVDMEPVIRDNFQRLLDRIDTFITTDPEGKGDQVLDIRRWLNYFTLDVIGDMAFGLPMGFVRKGSDSKEGQTLDGVLYDVCSTIDALHLGARSSVTVAQIASPQVAQHVKHLLRCTTWLRNVSGAQHASDFEAVYIHQLRRRLDKGIPDRPSQDFMSKVLEDRDGKSRHLPFPQLVAEAGVFMSAGSDTTTSALSSTLYFLLSNPKCLQKLQEEVETRISLTEPCDIISYDLVRDLPYLRACIDETMRLRPPLAYPLQRLVVSPEGVMIAGHHVKPGTVVAVSPYTIHRNKTLYPNPDEFNPDRWFDPAQTENLKRYNIVFSQGPRQCLGRHIAIVELQILVSSLTRRYDMQLAHQDQDLLVFDRFISNVGPLPILIKRRQVGTVN